MGKREILKLECKQLAKVTGACTRLLTYISYLFFFQELKSLVHLVCLCFSGLHMHSVYVYARV